MQESRKFLLPVLLSLVVFAAALTLGLAHTITAQDNPPAPTWLPAPTALGETESEVLGFTGSTGSDEAPDWAQARIAEQRAYYAPFMTKTLREFRVVYISAEGSIADSSLLSPQRFSNQSGIAIAHTWDDVLRLDEQEPLQALLIHESARPFIDTTWVQAAYRRGVVIGGINLFFRDMSGIVGNYCVHANAESPYRDRDFFVLYYYVLTVLPGPDSTTAAAINDQALMRCRAAHRITIGGFLMSDGEGQGPISSLEELTGFFDQLKGYIIEAQAKINRRTAVYLREQGG